MRKINFMKQNQKHVMNEKKSTSKFSMRINYGEKKMSEIYVMRKNSACSIVAFAS